MKQTSTRLRTGLVIAVGVSVATITAILLLTMDSSTWSGLDDISLFFFLLVLGLVVGKWLATCVRAKLLIRAMGSEMGFGRITKAVLAGGFAGAITPYHSAGIPVEIYFFSLYGLTGGEATAVVMTGASLSILLFTVMLPITLVVSASKIQVSFGVRTLLVTAGIIALFFFLAVVYSMKEPEKLASTMRERAPSFLKKRPGFNRFIDRFFKGVGDFSDGLRTILGAPRKLLASIVLLTFVFWAAGVLVTPFILWGIGRQDLFWTGLLAQLVVTCILPFVPIPGESGMAEAAFAGVFALLVQRNLVGFVTLAWRFFQFYLVILVLGIVFIIALRDVEHPDRAAPGHAQQPL